MAEEEETYLTRLLSLQNDGANATNDMDPLRTTVDESLPGLVSTRTDPALWTEFLATYADILLSKRGMRPSILAPHFSSLIMGGLADLVALTDVSDQVIESTNPHPRFATLLLTLRSKLLLQRARQSILQEGDIDVHSRLWVSKKQTVAGEISKIEYRTQSIQETVWDIGNENNNHNLTMADELQEISGISADVDVQFSDIPADVRVQFNEDLLTKSIFQINSETYSAELTLVYNLTGIGDNRGQMVFQQEVYPPLSRVMVAAASNNDGKNFTCVADQEATSSSYVVHDGLYYVVSGKPDSGLLVPASKDPIAMLEIKPEDDLDHQDLAKCILWSSIAGQALVRAGVPRAQIRIPFLIGSGVRISLFVTELTSCNGNGDEGRYCPTVRCMLDRLSLHDRMSRRKVLVAFVVLLGRLKAIIGSLPGGFESILDRRRKSREAVSRNIVSKKPRTIARQSTSATPQEATIGAVDRANTMDEASGDEMMASEAVMKFCPETRNLKFPWPRYHSIFGGDDAEFYQQCSPFFFRGQCLQSPVFYKVWRQNDDDVDEAYVQQEVDLLGHAFNCGVSVPSVFKYGKVQSADHLFFVLQMSDCGDRHFVDAHDELLAYSLSLVENVWKLHSKGSILHCDLKPRNVVWNGTNVTLLDFGHAQKIGEVSPVPGTAGFEAPEVTRGQENTCLTDAFSVGKVLLEQLGRITEKDEFLQAFAQGLCEPELQRRKSLEDAHKELVEHQRCQRQPVSKKSNILDTKSLYR